MNRALTGLSPLFGQAVPTVSQNIAGMTEGTGLSATAVLRAIGFDAAATHLTDSLDDFAEAFSGSSDLAEEWNTRVGEAISEFATSTQAAAQSLIQGALSAASAIGVGRQQAFGVDAATNQMLAGIFQSTDPAAARGFLQANLDAALQFADQQPGLFAGQQLQSAAMGLYQFASQNLFGDELVAAQQEAVAAIERGRDLQLDAIQSQIDIAAQSLTELVGIREGIALLATALDLDESVARSILHGAGGDAVVHTQIVTAIPDGSMV